MISPGFTRDPFKRVVAIGGVVTVNMILTLGAIAPAAILIDCGITVPHHLAPAAQNRSQQWTLRIWQPPLRAVRDVLALRHGNAVRRTVQNRWKARSAALRQKDESVQPDPIAHRHHRLKTAGAIDRQHQRSRLKSVPGFSLANGLAD